VIYIGIDPGLTGGITMMKGDELEVIMMPKTEQDIMNLFSRVKYKVLDNVMKIKCIIEAQHAFPGMAAGAQWSFAQHYGFLRGCLVSLQIPFIEVSPQKWMSYFGLKKTKEEDKRTYKKRILQKAQNLYPQSSVALQTADSLMICEFLRLTDNRS
jgi:hypothetical protein